MKKIIWLILLSALILIAASVPAEQATVEDSKTDSTEVTAAFTMFAAVPDGFTLSGEYVSDSLYYGQLIPNNKDWGSGLVIIALDEAAAGRSFTDMTQDVINSLIQDDVSTLGEKVSFTEAVSASGGRILTYQILDPEEARLEAYTLDKGYQIRCVIFPGNGQTLNESHLQAAVAFISGVRIE
ncbi:MAG: hypothetical protein IJT77_06790 [Clostridia bacterium]|nr:hypothetical protein [Clostridia bacterium]